MIAGLLQKYADRLIVLKQQFEEYIRQKVQSFQSPEDDRFLFCLSVYDFTFFNFEYSDGH